MWEEVRRRKLEYRVDTVSFRDTRENAPITMKQRALSYDPGNMAWDKETDRLKCPASTRPF